MEKQLICVLFIFLLDAKLPALRADWSKVGAMPGIDLLRAPTFLAAGAVAIHLYSSRIVISAFKAPHHSSAFRMNSSKVGRPDIMTTPDLHGKLSLAITRPESSKSNGYFHSVYQYIFSLLTLIVFQNYSAIRAHQFHITLLRA